jgi:CRISPR-associated protein Csd1
VILQRLVDYFDRISTDPATAGVLPRPGYSLQKVSFCVVLRGDETLQGIQSLLDPGAKNPVPRQLLVPGQSKPPGQGINPCFLWDNAAYLLGFKPDDPKPERTRESFERFRARHLEAEAEVHAPAFSAVCAFLRSWSPQHAAQRAAELEEIVGSFGVFKIAGEAGFVHDDPRVAAYWAARADAADGSADGEGFCLVTGVRGPIARLHEPKIKGVAGTQSSGALLVSFNDKAYESFGKEQGDNAPVGVAAAFKYANALNYLLNGQGRRISLGDTTVVFWADRPALLEELADDIFADVPPPKPDAPPEDRQRAEQVRAFLTQLRDGHAHGEAFDRDSDVGFYVLGLSPNASRISVRFWVQSTVGEMQQRLAQHLQDSHLAGAREGDPPLVVRRIVQATGRAEFASGAFEGFDADAVPPLLAGAVARAVFTGGPYPQMLLGAMLNRLRADGYVNHARVATIKACLVRNSRLNGNPKEVPVSLDVNRTEPAYVTGRLFALLEKIQTDSAAGDLNATIKDRYFSSASATPGVVFPRLIRLSQHHLAKMEPRQKVYYERQLGEVMNKLDGFASHFPLEDQGLFAVGYFHQRQDLFTSKKDKEGDRE